MLYDLLFRLRSLFRRRKYEAELEEEIAFHLEEAAAQQWNRGAEEREAKRAALLRFGGVEQTKEQCRDARGTVFFDLLQQNLRYAGRQMKASPVFSAIVVLILALGIGANAAIFSVLNAVILQSLPVSNPPELMVPAWIAKRPPKSFDSSGFEPCFASIPTTGGGGCTFPYRIFQLFAQRHDIFSSVAAFAGPTQLNAQIGMSARVVNAEIVSGSFFHTLGVGAALGKTIQEEDDQPGSSAGVVLAYSYWQGEFGRNPQIVGKTIRLNSFPFVVLGVATPEFTRLSPGKPVQAWIPIHSAMQLGISQLGISLATKEQLAKENSFWLEIVARRRTGVSMASVQAVLSSIFANEMTAQKVLTKDANAMVETASAQKALSGIRQMVAKPLYVLMSAVGMLLLITCMNIAGLMTARAAARIREISIRLALGAGSGKILFQLLTESISLALLGGLAGSFCAWWFTRSLLWLIPIRVQVPLDARVFLFTAAVSLTTGILYGLLPAFRMIQEAAPKLGPSRNTSFASRRALGSALIAAQIALSLVLLLGAGLFTRTLINLAKVNVGFNARNLALFTIEPGSLHYTDEHCQNLYRLIRERLSEAPGVIGVTYSESPLLASSRHSTDLKISGHIVGNSLHLYRMPVGPDFFSTMGMRLESGRLFTHTEQISSQHKTIVNESFVRKYLAGQSPLGLRLGDDAPPTIPDEIIGVVSDAKYDSVRDSVQPTMYTPLLGGSATFEIRAASDPAGLLAMVRKIVEGIDPLLPVTELKTQMRQIDETLWTERLMAQLSLAFGVMAIALVSLGVYGLLSYEVSRRTREIGIRMALGEAPLRILRKVLAETLGVTLCGLAAGIPIALFCTRALSSLLFEVQSGDGLTLFGIVTILLTVALIAGTVPARRAASIEPNVALRYE